MKTVVYFFLIFLKGNMADTQERSRDPPEESHGGEGIHTDESTDEKVLKNSLNLNKDQSDSNSDNKDGTKKNQQDIQIGKRTATLFLSSHSLKLKDKTKNNVNSNSQSPNSPVPPPSPVKQSNSTLSSSSRRSSRLSKKDRVIPDELKLLKVQKEFTFTGYDIMADGE